MSFDSIDWAEGFAVAGTYSSFNGGFQATVRRSSVVVVVVSQRKRRRQHIYVICMDTDKCPLLPAYIYKIAIYYTHVIIINLLGFLPF